MRKSKDWWRNHYDSWISSDLSIAEYSKNNGFSKSTFYGWIKKFRGEGSKKIATNSEVKWAALSSISPENTKLSHSNSSSLKVVIGKASIEIPSNFDPKLLNSVIKVLVNNA